MICALCGCDAPESVDMRLRGVNEDDYAEGPSRRVVCSVHRDCKRECLVIFQQDKGRIVFEVMGEHCGEEKDFRGIWNTQWKVLAVSQSETVPALVLELSKAGCPHSSERRLASYLSVGENPQHTHCKSQ